MDMFFISALGISALVGYETEINHCIGLCTDTRKDYHFLLSVSSIHTSVYRQSSRHRCQYAIMTGNYPWFKTLWRVGNREDILMNIRTNERKDTLFHLLCTEIKIYYTVVNNRTNHYIHTSKLVTTDDDIEGSRLFTPQDDILVNNHFQFQYTFLTMIGIHQVGILRILSSFSGIKQNGRTLVNKEGETPLIVACENNRLDMIDVLLEYSDVIETINHATTEENGGHTALHTAARKGYLSIVQRLLRIPKINIHVRNKAGNTPLFSACYAESYGLEIVQELLQHYKFTVPEINNLRNVNNESIVHVAVSNGGFEWLCYFVRKFPGLDLSVRDNEQETILSKAVKQNDVDIVKELLMYDADTYPIDWDYVDTDMNSLLHISCQRYAVPMVKALLQYPRYNVNAVDRRGNTALHLLATDDSADELSRITDIFFPYYMDDDDNNHSYHHHHRYNIDQMNDEGKTVLQLACECNNIALVRNICRSQTFSKATKRTAIGIAKKYNYTNIVHILERYHTATNQSRTDEDEEEDEDKDEDDEEDKDHLL